MSLPEARYENAGRPDGTLVVKRRLRGEVAACAREGEAGFCIWNRAIAALAEHKEREKFMQIVRNAAVTFDSLAQGAGHRVVVQGTQYA